MVKPIGKAGILMASLYQEFMKMHYRPAFYRRARPDHQSPQVRNGFTTLELLVVVVMAGSLMTIAALSWISFLNARTLSQAQDQALQLIRQGQAEAIRHKIPWQATFREVNHQWQGTTHNADSLPSEGAWIPFNPTTTVDRTRSNLYRSSNGYYRVQFDHHGRVNGQLGKLTFMNIRGGRTKRCVVVSTLLGALRKSSQC
ncbi:MAG: prepilin-type cleavage/methylation domain-containing protein [Leptolyngbyaceae cyanobacterium SL_7_1]|nr:prepilin-type cleavage/methylation domain-containing protein [Leptolyngbyaceae cyanobacterium SL_7_1]